MRPLIDEHKQEFYLCILFQLFLPLFPLLLELWVSGVISNRSLMISTAIYAISIGNASRHKIIFGICVIISMFFSVGFGAVIGGVVLKYSMPVALITILSIFTMSVSEKHAVHIRDKVACWDFASSDDKIDRSKN